MILFDTTNKGHMENKQVKYQTGEVSLKKIGDVLGKITPTMVNRLFNAAHEKVKILTYDKPIKLFTLEEDEALDVLLHNNREIAADEYIKFFREVKFDIYDFIMTLNKLQYITDSELKLLKEEEIEGMTFLKLLFLDEKETEKTINIKVKNILKTDLDNEKNIFKLYQSIVSRVSFPDKKRGRPRKEFLV